MSTKSKSRSKSKTQPNKSGSTQNKSSQSQSQSHSSQTHGKTSKPVHKERGFWLILVLGLMVVHGIIAAIFYSTAKTGAAPNAHTWIISFMVIHSVLNIIAAIGIWFWQKWSLQVYAASTILAVIAGLMTGFGMYSVFYMMLPVVIVGWLLRTKWSYFE